MHDTCSNSFESQDHLSTSGCAVSEKNSRSSPRSLGQSPMSSPGRLLMKACPCCVESSPSVRKRLADQLDDDTESAGADRKRMRRSLNTGRRLSKSPRACVTGATELHNLAGDIRKTGSNVASEVVKRGRGRPRKVSRPLFIVQCIMMLVAVFKNIQSYKRYSSVTFLSIDF